MCKDIGALLIYEKGKLCFLLENVLYVALCSFKVNVQGGQNIRSGLDTTLEGSLTCHGSKGLWLEVSFPKFLSQVLHDHVTSSSQCSRDTFKSR